jgi:K+-transporting ATPase ATPase C chain
VAGATDENPLGYDGSSSAGSNLGPTNTDLLDRIVSQVDDLRAANGDRPIPVDMVTTSASGLDPHISPANADYQVARIAAARGMTEDAVREIVARHTQQPMLGFLGQPTVNVLELNLDLDGLLARVTVARP